MDGCLHPAKVHEENENTCQHSLRPRGGGPRTRSWNLLRLCMSSRHKETMAWPYSRIEHKNSLRFGSCLSIMSKAVHCNDSVTSVHGQMSWMPDHLMETESSFAEGIPFDFQEVSETAATQ